MKGFADTCLQYFVYLGYRAVTALAGVLPLRACDWLGKSCGWLAWVVAVPYRRLARRNLRIAFAGEHDEVWIRDVTRRQFEAIGRNFLISLKLTAIPPRRSRTSSSTNVTSTSSPPSRVARASLSPFPTSAHGNYIPSWRNSAPACPTPPCTVL